MNKAQEVISKIKLQTHEKKLLASLVGYAVYLLLINQFFTADTSALIGIPAALILVFWGVMNLGGIFYVIVMAFKGIYENVTKFPRLHKILIWFRTNDRH